MGKDEELVNGLKNVKKNRQFKYEFNNPSRTEDKLSEIIEFEKAAKKIQQQVAESIKAGNDLMRAHFQALNSTVKEQMRSTIEHSFLGLSEIFNSVFDNIDWESINQELEDNSKLIEKHLKEYEREFWCIDMELFAHVEDKELILKVAPKYIEENLKDYISEFIREPMYKFHATLINEAYEAYRAGLYKLCVFPLLATVEYVIISWYNGTINADKKSIKQTKYISSLRSNVDPNKFKNVEEDPMFKVFAFSVIRVYRELFKIQHTSRSKLNRNTIAHGLHNYDSLSKNDALKLFQLLKAATVLKFFDKNKLPIKKMAEL